MSEKVEKTEKRDGLCSISGCKYKGVFLAGGQAVCEFHQECFDRGPAYTKTIPLVTRFAAYGPVVELKGLIGRLLREVIEQEISVLVAEIQTKGAELKLDVEVLKRKEFVNGIGEHVPEPGVKYAARVNAYLVRFVNDQAARKLGMKVPGVTDPSVLPWAKKEVAK